MISFFAVLLLSLLIRLVLSSVGTLDLDQSTFIAWSMRVYREGFLSFYSQWSDYLPGYVYVLWILAWVHERISLSQEVLYKIPAILADMGTGYLIYHIVQSTKAKSLALLAAATYLFNPAIIANSTLWGQVDSFTAFFLLLSLSLLSPLPVLAGVSFALGALVKPQILFVAPLVLLLLLKQKKWLRYTTSFLLPAAIIYIAAYIPFASGNVVNFIFERLGQTMNQYPYTSINAFNFWALSGMWRSDVEGIVTPKLIGYALFLVTAGGVSLYRIKSLKEKTGAYYLSAIILLSSYLFFTRMHERHMLPVLAPLIVAATSVPSLIIPYAVLSLIYIINLRYAYVWITKDFTEIIGPEMVTAVSALAVGVFIFMAARPMLHFKKIKKLFEKVPTKTTPLFSVWKVSARAKRIILVTILVFGAVTRLINIGNPPQEYFDEVYHAFTAKYVLHSDAKAWEWWNESPEGFAFEWTHPPMAKLGMALSMRLLGESAIAWRLPAVFMGVGCLYLVYKIGSKLFNDDLVGLLSAGALSLEGLMLAMNRIGMNDTYLLFFVLLSFYLFLRDRHFASAFALGCAAASKWSVLWYLPILVVGTLLLRKKITPKMLWYVILPPILYIASYWQLFTTGHGYDIFWGMQKQMWWYHTSLVAEHYYTSPWWSWPLMLKSIWFYTSGEVVQNGRTVVSNIYGFGNPFVFWAGLTSIFALTYWSVKERSRESLLIVFAYAVFFVPWALSPRIMFLYHYLPSVPFMAIALGVTLRKTRELIIPFFVVSGILFLYFYPHWTALPIPTWLDNSYYWFSTWK